jgi:prolipoprotein diacylglyceryltransferase
VLNLVGFLILALTYIISKKQGLPTALYLIYYGVVRTILESFRQEEYILRLGSLPISQVFSAIMIAAGIALLIYIIVKSKKMKVSNEQKK